MVVSIGNDVLSDSVDSDSSEAVELALTASVLTKLLHEYTVGIEHLGTNKIVYGFRIYLVEIS